MPNREGQIVANDMSKYAQYYAARSRSRPTSPRCRVRSPHMQHAEHVLRAIGEVRKLLKKSKVIVPGQIELEISHHYGMEQF